jgi:hypothetical protein
MYMEQDHKAALGNALDERPFDVRVCFASAAISQRTQLVQWFARSGSVVPIH